MVIVTVTVAGSPGQTEPVPVIEPTGSGLTLIVTSLL